MEENIYGLTCDYHTHTVFSHGKGTILQNAESAKEKGLGHIVITDHGFSHPAYGVRRRELDEMRKKCIEATEKTGVITELGVESNILGIDGKTDVKEKDYEKLDVYLSGIHRFIMYDKANEWYEMLLRNWAVRKFKKEIPESLIKRNTEIYINTIKNNPIDILTHPGYLVFADAVEVAKCCSDYGTYFEINSRKTHLSDEDWFNVSRTEVKFVVDSDAHKPSKVGEVSFAIETATKNGIKRDRIINIDGKVPQYMRFKEFKGRL